MKTEERKKQATAVKWVIVLLAASVVAVAIYGAVLALNANSVSSSKKGSTVSNSSSPLIGKPVPQFSLPELADNGKAVQGSSLSPEAFSGKPLVINFFASWCGPCNAETPMIAKAADGYGSKIQFLGVDENDTRSKALTFIAQKGVKYPVVSDSGSLQTRYFLLGLPTTVFVNGKGDVVGVVVGQITHQELYHWLTAIAPK